MQLVTPAVASVVALAKPEVQLHRPVPDRPVQQAPLPHDAGHDVQDGPPDVVEQAAQRVPA